MSPLAKTTAVLAPPAFAAIAALALWESATRLFAIPIYLLPPPSAVAHAAYLEAGSLAYATLTTGLAALTGFLASALLGVATALLLGTSRLLERAIYPYAIILQTIPIVAVAPLLVLWCGVGLRAVCASAFLVSLFPVITNALAGVRAVDPALRDLFALYGASRMRVLVRLELPHAAPEIATGLRIACGLAVIGAVVGEFVAGFSEGRKGLGIIVLSSYRQLRTDLTFAAVGCSAILGIAMFGAVTGISYIALRRWHAGAR